MCRFNLVVKPKAELDRDLPVIDLIILDVAAAFDDLKPVQIVQCLGCFGDRVLHRVFHAGFGRTRQLYLLVNVFAHKSSRQILFGLLYPVQFRAIKVPTISKIIPI